MMNAAAASGKAYSVGAFGRIGRPVSPPATFSVFALALEVDGEMTTPIAPVGGVTVLSPAVSAVRTVPPFGAAVFDIGVPGGA